MLTLTKEKASQIILESIQRINQSFITRAERQWDIDGQGCFALYIRWFVSHRWLDMVALN